MVFNGYDRCPNFKIKKMKKLFFFTLLCAFSLAGFSQEKNDDNKKNIVKVNVGGIFLGSGALNYERAVSTKSAIQFGIAGGALWTGFYNYSFFGVEAAYRCYFTGKAPKGTYFSPAVAFMSGNTQYQPLLSVPSLIDNTTTGSGSMISMVIGHQWIFHNNWTFDINAGIANWSLNWKNSNSFWDNTSDSEPFNGIWPKGAVSFGYNF